jgi:hypothetical protein
MACFKYVISYGSSGLSSAIDIIYVDCEGITRSASITKGDTQEINATQILKGADAPGISFTRGEQVGEGGAGGSGDGFVLGGGSSGIGGGVLGRDRIYYELSSCIGNDIAFTLTPNTIPNERVRTSDGRYWTYTGSSLTRSTAPGVLATGLVKLNTSGCPPTITPPPTPPPTPQPSNLFAIELCYGSVSCELNCENCQNGINPKGTFYIDVENFALASFVYEDSQGVRPANANFYTDLRSNTCRPSDSSGRLGTQTLCPSVQITPPPTPTATPTPTPTPTIEEGRLDSFFTLRSCTDSNDLLSTTRAPRFTNERVVYGGRTYTYTGGTTKKVFGSTILTERSLTRTGASGCPSIDLGGGGGGITPPPPPPTLPPSPETVNCSIAQVVSPNLESLYNSLCSSQNFRQSDFTPGNILIDGKVVGNGQVNVTLKIGQTYNVEFRKPSHPLFSFSNGSPSSYSFRATSSTTRFESVFRPSFIANTGTLTVNANITPNIAGTKVNPKIFIKGIGEIGRGSVENYELDPGEYTVYFEPIRVANMIYVTPEQRKVTIRVCETTTVDLSYNGIPLPENYWLKEIDGAEKTQYNSILTQGMFSNNISNLVRFYSSSLSDSLDNHYTHVYHENPSSVTSSIQFSVAYGHVRGSGSNDEGGQYNDTPTRAIYGQYRNIILGSATDRLNLSGTPTDHFYVVSYQKDRRDTRADYNALEINLAHLSGSEFINGEGYMAAHTGSNVKLGGEGKVLRLISDYKINDDPQRAVPSAPLEYNIVSGSIEDGVYNSTSPHYYGKLYPSIGVVLLDAEKLDVSASFGTVESREVDGKNQLKLFTAISGAAQYSDASGDLLGMKARATKEELVYYYYLHVKNNEFNFSNNPSIYNTEGIQFLQYGVPSNVRISSDILDNAAVINSDLLLNPKVFITTIGLYDADRNLLAVAKVSKAELKSFTDEVMFTVKLKF